MVVLSKTSGRAEGPNRLDPNLSVKRLFFVEPGKESAKISAKNHSEFQ